MNPSLLDLVCAIWHSSRQVAERFTALVPLLKIAMEDLYKAGGFNILYSNYKDAVMGNVTNEQLEKIIDDGINKLLAMDDSDVFDMAWAASKYVRVNGLQEMKTDLLLATLKQFDETWVKRK